MQRFRMKLTITEDIPENLLDKKLRYECIESNRPAEPEYAERGDKVAIEAIDLRTAAIIVRRTLNNLTQLTIYAIVRCRGIVRSGYQGLRSLGSFRGFRGMCRYVPGLV